MAERLLHAMGNAARRRYGGEPVSELAHSLQCADLAAEAGADDDLVLACLLHDVGRYAVDQRQVYDSKEITAERPARGRGHHELGADLIAPYVPARVAWLVRMHADAKRYLCAREPAYFAHLTPASKHTLTLQGGIMSAVQASAIDAHPWLAGALQLRRWDDRAKVVDKRTRPLDYWEPLLRQVFAAPRHE